jgi:hypothetical protein
MKKTALIAAGLALASYVCVFAPAAHAARRARLGGLSPGYSRRVLATRAAPILSSRCQTGCVSRDRRPQSRLRDDGARPSSAQARADAVGCRIHPVERIRGSLGHLSEATGSRVETRLPSPRLRQQGELLGAALAEAAGSAVHIGERPTAASRRRPSWPTPTPRASPRPPCAAPRRSSVSGPLRWAWTQVGLGRCLPVPKMLNSKKSPGSRTTTRPSNASRASRQRCPTAPLAPLPQRRRRVPRSLGPRGKEARVERARLVRIRSLAAGGPI